LEHLRCDHEGRFRATTKLIEKAEQTASCDLVSMSAYIRRALIRQLESDGFSLQSEPGRLQ
jgi:hypothetical protein